MHFYMLQRNHQKETTENNLIYDCIQKTKIPRSSLNEEVTDLSSDSRETLMTDMEGDTRSWGNTLCSGRNRHREYTSSPQSCLQSPRCRS